MDINLEDLLKGQGTKIKNKEYLPTSHYVEPFLNRLNSISGMEIKCHAELPKQVTIQDDKDNLTYNRVWIEGIFPDEYTIDNHEKVIGMAYGLDTRVPICKFYLSSINSACTNMMVFNPSLLKVQTIEENTPIDFTLLDSVLDAQDEVHKFVTALKNSVLINNIQTQEKVLGEWCRKCLIEDYSNGISKVKLSPNTAIKSFKSLFLDEKSDYYSEDLEEIDWFTIYNAWTYIISNEDSDIMNKFEKTYLISKILNLNIHEC